VKPIPIKLVLSFALVLLSGITAFSQIQINGSYYNVSRPSGGPVVKGDVLELHSVIAVPSGTTISNLSYTDVIPTNTTYVAGTLRVATNENTVPGTVSNTGAYSDAADGDRGQVIGTAITVYMGTGATSSAGGSVVGGSTTPVFSNVATIMMVTYQVTVTGNTNLTINTGGTFHYTQGATAKNTNVTSASLFIYKPYTCMNLGSTNSVTDESAGTFGSGVAQNRSTSSSNVTGYTFVNLNSSGPGDGKYSIANNTSSTDYSGASPATSDKVWSVWDIVGDHSGTNNSTGNPATGSGSGGYLLVVNGTYAPSTIFHTVVSGLTLNTTYTMSFWVRNLCPSCGNDPATGSSSGTPGVKPNIAINLNNHNFYSSGDIAYSGNWVQKAFTFNSETSSTATFDVINNAPGGGGNDFVMDDLAVNQCLVILPVGLSSFTGRLTSEGVTLNWQTEAAATTAYFDIERSSDGTRFYSIGQVAASTDTSRYTYTDQLLTPDAPAFFYRLRILDHDGGTGYSSIVRINTGNTAGNLMIRLAPNPTRGGSTLNVWSDEPGTAQISLWTSTGALVYSRQAALSGGANAVDIRLPSHLPTGIYIVKTIMGSQSAVTRLAVE
jgi:hypothetical protein